MDSFFCNKTSSEHVFIHSKKIATYTLLKNLPKMGQNYAMLIYGILYLLYIMGLIKSLFDIAFKNSLFLESFF